MKLIDAAESIIDKAIDLQYIGGVYGNQRPTAFICLTLKLLQLQPEKEILLEYLLAEEFKWVSFVVEAAMRR
jgi:pre-mRNA-splicing factor 38A